MESSSTDLNADYNPAHSSERKDQSDIVSNDELKNRLEEEAINKLKKPNIPNVNVPEKIIICLDVCNNSDELFRLGDGTTYTPLNMFKRALDFFLHSKSAINNKSEFAFVTLGDEEVCWLHDFTTNISDILELLDITDVQQSFSSEFNMNTLFDLVEHKVKVPEYKIERQMLPPPYVVRLLLMYGRSNSVPRINNEHPYLKTIMKHFYFYIDILLSHEENCALHKCEEIYDSLQDLDNGYSFVFEVSRNATKIHDCIAKLLAHPLQRPLQKDTDYKFG